jgi:hypothetical protein
MLLLYGDGLLRGDLPIMKRHELHPPSISE